MLSSEGAASSQARDRAFEHDLAATGPRPWPEIDDVVGDLDHLRFVLDDQHGVALVS